MEDLWIVLGTIAVLAAFIIFVSVVAIKISDKDKDSHERILQTSKDYLSFIYEDIELHKDIKQQYIDWIHNEGDRAQVLRKLKASGYTLKTINKDVTVRCTVIRKRKTDAIMHRHRASSSGASAIIVDICVEQSTQTPAYVEERYYLTGVDNKGTSCEFEVSYEQYNSVEIGDEVTHTVFTKTKTFWTCK